MLIYIHSIYFLLLPHEMARYKKEKSLLLTVFYTLSVSTKHCRAQL